VSGSPPVDRGDLDVQCFRRLGIDDVIGSLFVEYVDAVDRAVSEITADGTG
jgi:hypothetical protein